jgi:hypothetical protein
MTLTGLALDLVGVLIVAVGSLLSLNILTLGLIVLIRTFLSMTLQLEVEGSWPWQRGSGIAVSQQSSEARRGAA